MKKCLIFSIILVTSILFTIFVCGWTIPELINQGPQALQEQQKLYIPMIAKGLQATYWDAVREGALRAAEDYNVNITFEGPQFEGQTEEQLRMVETALARNPASVVLSAVDARAVTPYLEQAQAAGIPVIGFDSGVDSPIVRTTVATDNYGAGQLAAEKMVELLNGNGKVAMIVQDTTSKVAIDRRDGFVDTIEQQYPNMDIVKVGYGGGEVDLSADLTKQMLLEHPDIKGIFGGNEGSAQGVVKGVRELGKQGSIIIVGFDSGEPLIDAIREGIVAGAVTQHPRDMGYQAVEAAIRAYRGETQPTFIDTGFTWYDKTNIDAPEIQRHLYR